MLKDHIRLVIENSSEEKAFVLEVAEGTTVESLISHAILKAKWEDRKLTPLTAKLFDVEAKQFIAITQPLNDVTVSNMQKFEIRLSDEKIATVGSINVDITINGITQANQQFELSDNANVQDLIMAILVKIERNEGNSMIGSVRIFHPDFDEWSDVTEPYSNEAIESGRRYSVAISCKESEIPPNTNSPEKFDQVNSLKTSAMSDSSSTAESEQHDMAYTQPCLTQSSVATEPIGEIVSDQSNSILAQIPQGETITRQAPDRVAMPRGSYNAHTDSSCNKTPFSNNLPENRMASTIDSCTIHRSALGQTAILGSLYDIRKDQFVHGNIFNRQLPSELIERRDGGSSYIYDYDYVNSIKDKLRLLKLEGEASLSVLSGLIKVNGAASYIDEKKTTNKSIQCCFHQNIKTCEEKISLNSKAFSKFIMNEAINDEVTHVVVGIEYGVNTNVSLVYSLTDETSTEAVKGKLSGELEKLKSALSGKLSGSGEFSEDESFKKKSLKISIFADIKPSEETAPTTIEEAITTINQIPTLVNSKNNGRGVPQRYMLLNIKEFERIFSIQISCDKILREIGAAQLQKISEMMSEVEYQFARISDFRNEAHSCQMVISSEMRAKIEEYHTNCIESNTNLQSELKELVLDIRSGNKDVDELTEWRAEFMANSPLKKKNMENFFEECKIATRAINLYKELSEHKIPVVQSQDELNTLKRETNKNDKTLVVLFFSFKEPHDEQLWQKTFSIFLKLILDKNTNITLRAISSDSTKIQENEPIEQGHIITIIKNGVYQVKDYIKEYDSIKKIGYAIPNGHEMKSSFSDRSRQYDLEDIEDFIQGQTVNISLSSEELEQKLSLKYLKKLLGDEARLPLSELDERVFERIWTNIILGYWQDEAVSCFKKSILNSKDIKIIQNELKKLQTNDFWSIKILQEHPLQRLVEEYRKVFDEANLQVCFEAYRTECFSILLEQNHSQNHSVANELRFLEEFIRVLKEEADDKFFKDYRPFITSSNPHEAKFKSLLQKITDCNNSSLSTMANSLLQKDHFYLSEDFFKIIERFFEPTKARVYRKDGKIILEVIGSAFSMKDVVRGRYEMMAVSELENIQEPPNEIHIISHLSFKLNEDLERPGVNLLIKASRLLIPDTVVINTSGKDADDQYSSDAGRDGSGIGRDGSDGHAGESAGNILIEADYIDHPDNLERIANGGRGSNGQDGGDGIDGKIGKGMSKNELDGLFPPTAAYYPGARFGRVKKVIDSIDRKLDTIIKAWWTGKDANTWLGVWENIKEGLNAELSGSIHYTDYVNRCIYVEAKLKSGMTVIFALECSGNLIWTSCQSYLLVKGDEGSPGGDGGAAGKGGQGGFAGSITVNGKVTRGEAGESGSNGTKGKNGTNGKNGWDIGWLDYSVSGAFGADHWPKYHGTDEKTKLELKPYKDNSKDRIVCPYRKRDHFDYYMEMVGARLEHPKQGEATRSQQRQKDMQHQTKATRKSNIDVSAMAQHQSNVFTAAELMIGALQQSHQAGCQMVQKSIELEQHQSQVKADMTVNRQVEYTQERSKPKARAPLELRETEPSWSSEKQVLLKKVFEVVGKIDWSEEMVQKLCPKKECNIKCDDHFLRKASQANWSGGFEQFLNFFTNEKENFEEKDFETLQTKKKQGARRVIRQFVLEIGEKNENKKIKALYEKYLYWLKKKGQNLIVFEESLTKIDKKCEKNKELMNNLQKNLTSKPSISSKWHIELYSQLNDFNIQLFEEKQDGIMILLENFNPISKNILRVTVDNKGGLHQLKHNYPFFTLERERLQKSLIYKSVLGELLSCKNSIELDSYLCHGCYLKMKPFILHSYMAFEEVLDVDKAIFEIRNVVQDETFPWNRLKFITEPFIGTNRILKALRDRLCSEGFQISSTELYFLINTILRMSRTSKYFVELMIWLIVSKEQSRWLVECVMLELENYFEKPVKPTIRGKLGAIDDKQTVFLLIEQLKSSSKFSFEPLEKIINLLQKETTTLLLSGLSLKEWPLVLKMDFWKEKLQSLMEWKDEETLQRVLHYLTTVEVIYTDFLLNRLFKIFEEKKTPLSTAIIIKIFEALYSEQCFLNDDFFSLLGTISPAQWLCGLDIDSQTVRNLRQLINIIINNSKISQKTKEILPEVVEIITEADKSCGNFAEYDEEDIKNWTKEYKTSVSLAEVLAVINRAIWLKENFFLRDTQKIAIVLFCLEGEKSRVLEQVSTGEGKSLIVVSVAIIRALRGEKVDVITSSSVLARRDAEANEKLFEMFNMKVGHNCSESLTERTDAYGRSQVLYGEITNFQRDHLLDRFYGKNILGDRKFESVIVDEVDSMLLDKGNNVLYLSHQIAGFDKLEAVFVYIWQMVNRPAKDQADYDLAFNTARLRENVIDNMYKRITKDDLNMIQSKEKKFSVDKVWEELIQRGVINAKGRLVIEKVDKNILESLETIEGSAKKRLIFRLNEVTRKQCMAVVPNFLVQFVEDHLTRWIENAKMALIMMAGNDYVVDIDRTGMKNDLHANITILDRDTGTDQASSQWEEGLHQFLQLKHGCKMSLMSLKAIFISNVSYFMLYKNLFGLTGTLGSVTEMELLQKIHEVEYVTIPTACGKRFYEETPAVCQNQNSWIERIEEEVRDYLTKKRSVLVICETVESVNFVSKKLSEKGIPNIFAYRREHEQFTIAERPLPPGQIIVATNLAGRGTDIKISDELRNAGGLHICLTYLPSNKRVEEQAFGRAARSGDPGSGRLVMIGDGAASGVRMIGIKTERDSQEIKRIAEVKDNYYEKIQAEEFCFKEFQKAYNELGKKFSKDSSEKVNLQENLIDQWAFWLDKWKYIIRNDGKTEGYKKELSVFIDQAKRYPIPRDYILMPHLIKQGKVLIEEKKYEEAISFLNQVIKTEPLFSEAAHYYKAYAVGKNFNWESASLTKSGKSRQLVISELRTAKRMFENLSDEQLKYSAVINRMKENFESTGIIQINSYEEQKQNVVNMYGQFISSIDDAIGSKVTVESFCKGIIDEPMSAALYEELVKKKIIRPMHIAEGYDTKSMENVCLEYGIPVEKMKSFLENEEGGDHNEIADRLKGSFTLQNRDDFWQELLSKGWLINQKTYVIVDETKLCEEFPLDFAKEKFEKGRLINFKKEMEESTSKIAKTSEQLNEIGEKTIFERETFKNLFKYVSYDKLLRKNLLIEMEVAERSKQEGVISFVNFDKLKKEHFALENIESTEVDAILTLLLNSKLISQQKDCYSLNAKDLSNLSLPSEQSVYTPAVRSVLQSSFAYRLAFNRLLQQIEEKSWPVKIPLVHKPQQGLLWDLVYAGVLCPVQIEKNVSAKTVVEDSYPEYFPKDVLTSLIAEEIPRLDLSDSWDLLLEREFLKEALCSDTYTIKDNKNKNINIDENEFLNNKMNTLLRSQMVLRKKTTRNSVVATIEQLKGFIAALEVPQPYLQWIYEALGSRSDGAVEELKMFMMNGLGEVIRFKEKAYTFKMFFNTNIVILLGLLQIAAGVAITLFTAGLMTNVGTGFISEGVGGLIFAVSALRSGYFSWSSYWQHKWESIMFTVVTCGIGAFLSRGAQVSRYGAKLTERGLEASGKSIADMCGKQLIKEVGVKTVGKEVLKDISLNTVKGVSFGLASSQVSQIVDNNLRTLCNELAESFLTKVQETAENHKISKTIDIVYARLGPEKGKMLIESHIKAALANKDMHNSWGATFLRYGAYVSRQIGDGLSRQKVSGQSTVQNLLYVGTYVTKGVGYANVVKNLSELGTMVNTLLDEVNDSLLKNSKIQYAKENEFEDEEELEQFRKSSMNLIHSELKSQMGMIIAKKFVEPVLQTGANYLVNFVGRQIKKQYNSCRDIVHETEFKKIKKDYKEMKTAAEDSETDEDTKKAIGKEYFDNLNELKKKIRSPKVYAEIVREGGHMDTQCLKAYGAILTEKLGNEGSGKAYKIVVEGKDGVTYTVSCGNSQNVEEIRLKVSEEHFTAVDSDGRTVHVPNTGFDCMLEALKSKIPDLGVSNEDWREQIANRIEIDPIIGNNIRQGLHTLSIRKGFNGGWNPDGSRKYPDDPSLYPNVKETEAKDDLVPHIEKNTRGRVIRSYGTIRGSMRGEGSKVSKKTRNLLREHSLSTDDIGHVIPMCWGGSGSDPDNVFPQDATMNRASGWMEKDQAKFVGKNDDNRITFDIWSEYDDKGDKNSKRPSRYGAIILGTAANEEPVRGMGRNKSSFCYEYEDLN